MAGKYHQAPMYGGDFRYSCFLKSFLQRSKPETSTKMGKRQSNIEDPSGTGLWPVNNRLNTQEISTGWKPVPLKFIFSLLPKIPINGFLQRS
jgi:hypothetical protein